MVQISKQGLRAAGLVEALPLDLFKALCDPSRLAVLAELATCEPPCTVGRIAECCPTDMSVHYELSTSSLARTLRSIADAIETCCPDGTPKGCCGTDA